VPLLATWLAFFNPLICEIDSPNHALQSLAALACILLFHRLARASLAPAALWATAMLGSGCCI
jgi:hypothetical protein